MLDLGHRQAQYLYRESNFALLADGDLDSTDLVLMPRPFRDDTSILYLPSVLYKC